MEVEKSYRDMVIGADVGGTNIILNVIGFAGGLPEIVLSERKKTSSVSQLSNFVNAFLDYAGEQGFQPVEGCFAVAGRIEDRNDSPRVEMTNVDLVVDSVDLERNTPLESVMLINDFEAISYALNILDPDDLIILNRGKSVDKGVRAVIGAGTGLGKSILHFDRYLDAYVPLPSEGGHSDLPLLSGDELKLAEFIKKENNLRYQICYEDVLSGKGLERIYQYLNQTGFPEQPGALSAQEISQTRETNSCSKESFQWFIRFYARCARNFVLDSLATGGLYIGGGIAVKNADSFTGFMEEFVRNETYHKVLKNVPVQIISNYDISSVGAAYAMILQKESRSEGS